MKKTFAFMILVAVSIVANATIWTVSNYSPAQFSTLDAAVSAAANGDTLYITGSPNNYNLSNPLTKHLTFVGAGFDPQKDVPYTSRIVNGTTYVTIKSGSSGSNFIGIKFPYGLSFIDNSNPSISNLDFEFCSTGSTGTSVNSPTYPIDLSNSTTISSDSNIVVRGCGTDTTPICLVVNNANCSVKNIMILNNIANCGVVALTSSSCTNVLYDHNIITNTNANTTGCYYCSAYFLFSNATITNNIFMTLTSIPTLTGAGCNFLNNVYVASGATSFPSYPSLSPTNIGVTNIYFDSIQHAFTAIGTQNANPAGVPTSFHLQPSSAGHNYATDGTDVGIYGGSGTYYWSGEPKWFPVVKTFNINNLTVPQNGNLNINVVSREAKDR